MPDAPTMTATELVSEFWQDLADEGEEVHYQKPQAIRPPRFEIRTEPAKIFDAAFFDTFNRYPFKVITVGPYVDPDEEIQLVLTFVVGDAQQERCLICRSWTHPTGEHPE